MKQFSYRAISLNNKTIHGVIKAKDERETVSFLRKSKLIPIKISEVNENGFSLPFLSKRPSPSDLTFFTRQLAEMLSAGLTLLQAMNILKNLSSKESVRDIVQGVIINIQEGQSFSKSLANYPEMFPPIYISLVKAAETSGLLDKIMLRLATNLEKQQQLRSSIKGALIYPAIVITMMVGAAGIMMIFVIPQLSVLYQSLNVKLPLSTKIIIGASNFTTKFWWLIIIGIPVLFILFRRWRKGLGKPIIDRIVLHLPVFGKLFKQIIITDFSRIFGLLLGTDISVIDSLNSASDIVGNDVYRNAILEVANRVEKGVSISDALTSNDIFPSVLVEMTKVGEQAGKLSDSLEKVSDYFEREVEQKVKTLTTAMEPFIMVLLGVGVGFLIFSIITPLYSVLNAINK